MTEPNEGDDMLRDLADSTASSRRRLLHDIATTTPAPTAVHYPRRALTQRLLDEWHAQHRTEEN
jgi:hypothetical protein